MKKFLVLFLALMVGMGICMAQKSAQKGTKKSQVTTVFESDIDCDHCVKKIMGNIPSLGKGIKDVQVDLKTKQITVVYDGSKNNEANLIKGFESLKVKAAPVKPAAEK